MKRSPRTDRIAADTLCLGLVIVPQPGRLAEVADEVRSLGGIEGGIEIGEPQSRGLPASVFTRVGEDEALLARIEALSPVLSVEIAYAQTLVE